MPQTNKNSYRGNQFDKVKSKVLIAPNSCSSPRPKVSTTLDARPSPKKSSSNKKINQSSLPKFEEYYKNNVNLIIGLQEISNLVKKFSSCKYCGSSDSVEVGLP